MRWDTTQVKTNGGSDKGGQGKGDETWLDSKTILKVDLEVRDMHNFKNFIYTMEGQNCHN